MITEKHVAWAAGGFVVGLLIASWPRMGAYASVLAVMATLTPKKRLVSLGSLFTGTSMLLLLVAFLRRQGPGMVSGTTREGGWSREVGDPFPWLLAGLSVLAAGLLLLALDRWLSERQYRKSSASQLM